MKETRKLYLFLFISFVLLSISFIEPYIGLTLVYALVIMLLLSALSIYLAPTFIRVEQKLSHSQLFKGETVEYSVLLKNRGLFFYPHISIIYASTPIFSYRGGWTPDAGLKPQNTFRSQNQITFPYRGVYYIGIEKIVITDALGLFTYVIDNIPLQKVVVYPVYETNYTIGIEDNPQRLSTSYDYDLEDYSTIEDVREYQPTDEFRRVHWQLSANRGSLLVKNFETLESHGILLFVDTKKTVLINKEQVAFEDFIIHHVASGAYRGMELGRNVTVFWGDGKDQNKEIHGEDSFLECLEKLAIIPFTNRDYTLPFQASSTAVDNVVFYVWRITPQMVETIFLLRQQSISPHSVLFFPS